MHQCCHSADANKAFQAQTGFTDRLHSSAVSPRPAHHEEEEEDFTSSANQLGCTDVPGLSITLVKNISSKRLSCLNSLK